MSHSHWTAHRVFGQQFPQQLLTQSLCAAVAPLWAPQKRCSTIQWSIALPFIDWCLQCWFVVEETIFKLSSILMLIVCWAPQFLMKAAKKFEVFFRNHSTKFVLLLFKRLPRSRILPCSNGVIHVRVLYKIFQIILCVRTPINCQTCTGSVRSGMMAVVRNKLIESIHIFLNFWCHFIAKGM